VVGPCAKGHFIHVGDSLDPEFFFFFFFLKYGLCMSLTIMWQTVAY
jgi:hypothetical protein